MPAPWGDEARARLIAAPTRMPPTARREALVALLAAGTAAELAKVRTDAPDLLAKIWTPFYTTKQSGTGLGLAFVREIARDHRARLDVESRPGGTTFTLALPET